MKVLYIADDGITFNSKEECLEHEKKLTPLHQFKMYDEDFQELNNNLCWTGYVLDTMLAHYIIAETPEAQEFIANYANADYNDDELKRIILNSKRVCYINGEWVTWDYIKSFYKQLKNIMGD